MKSLVRSLLSGSALVLAASAAALGASSYPDNDVPTQGVGSVVMMCLNSSGKAVPMTGGSCSGSVPTGSGGGGPVNIAPTDCSGSITTGGTAQTAISASATIHGFTIANIDASAGSGEPLWFSFTGVSAAATAASYPLSAPASTTFAGLTAFTTPYGFGTSHAVSVVAATTGHKFSCTYW